MGHRVEYLEDRYLNREKEGEGVKSCGRRTDSHLKGSQSSTFVLDWLIRRVQRVWVVHPFGDQFTGRSGVD